MQLTLLTPFAQPSVAAGPMPQREPAGPTRDAAALSQLDRIAAQNLRAPAHGLGGGGALLALLGGLVVLGSATMWRGANGSEARDARSAAVAERRDSQPAAAIVTLAAPAPAAVAAEAVTPSIAAAPASIPLALATPEPATAVVAVADPAADDAARMARVKQLADARRKAAQGAQERAAAEETQRLQLAQQRESERVQQQQLAEQARQRAAAEQARSQSLQLALDTRRSVSESCAAGSFIGRQFCRARECGKAEHQGDPVCVNLREDELAQQRASNNR